MTQQAYRHNERGAVAVIFAIMAVVLLSVAAIGVDLGNAMNRKKQTQTSADFAALAGAPGLPAASTAPANPANAVIIQQVADYINDNQPQTDGTNDCGVVPGSVTVGTLTNGDDADGEVTFNGTDEMTVLSPPSRVQFGLANAMGFSDTCVQSRATVAIKSGATGMAPYYVTPSCSSGAQVLKSNSGGLSIPFTVPVLSHDGESNTSVLSGDLTPDQVPLVDPTATPSAFVTITGTNLDAANIDSVGFFNSDQGEPKISNVFSNQSATSISVQVPVAVQSRQDVWWVRVHHKVETITPVPASSDKWSARSQARPLLVGDAVLSCDPDSASGNFGSIDLPWGGNDNDDLTKNIRDGINPAVSLKEYPGPPYPLPTPTSSDCKHNALGVWSTDGNYHKKTNCVNTVTGLEAKPAYDGYLATSNPKGRLIADTSDLCQNGAQNRPARYSLSPTNESINADTLSCFLVNDTLTLADTQSVATGADPLFDPTIWNSPRFAIVPVVSQDPSGNGWLPIVKFVGGFITDEVSGSSRSHYVYDSAYTTGLITQNPNKLRAIRMFFFDLDALPSPPDGSPLQDYLGSGPKIPTLIN